MNADDNWEVAWMASDPSIGKKFGIPVDFSLVNLPGRGDSGVSNAPPVVALRSWAARIHRYTLFTGISMKDCETIASAARRAIFVRGEAIHLEGDYIHQVVLLLSGCAKIMQSGENGSAVILRLCGPGDLVGPQGNTPQDRSRSTPFVIAESMAMVWDRSAFESLSARFPALRLNVGYILYKQLEEMEERFRELSTENVAVRLGRQILRMSKQFGNHTGGAFEIRITREELAQLVGTSLFTVSRLLSQWHRAGIVITRREGFSVTNLNALVKLIEMGANADA